MKNFNFNISLSILNHLGRNLYRNFITVIGEAISNSWDADAENVWISIDRDACSLVIKDDGLGMTEDDFQNKFLRIGYSKRKDGQGFTSKNRPYIGRKGIGKLALLSCAKRISILSKTKNSEYVGGTIDNSSLDNAIKDDLLPHNYALEPILESQLERFKGGSEHGTIIYFQDINDGIKNRVEYLRKLIALSFRFSLIDKSFKIFVNDVQVTEDELTDLADSTQFLWTINRSEDPYVQRKLIPNPNLRKKRMLNASMTIYGFIASVKKPSNLKIRGTEEKLTIDLYVNGRLREKDIMKHIPTARIVENYLYGQIFLDGLDGDDSDRFTSSREGVISDDPMFKAFLEEIKSLINKTILNEWDKWREEINEDGDSDNDRVKKKERKSKELFNAIARDFIPPDDSPEKEKIEGWVNSLSGDAQFNFSSYGECFVSENLIRKYLDAKGIPLSTEAQKESNKWREREVKAKEGANISFNIRRDPSDASYLDMGHLANLADKVDQITEAGLSRDAKEYKPIRDAVAHTSLLTDIAKTRLNLTYENIKARVRYLLKTRV